MRSSRAMFQRSQAVFGLQHKALQVMSLKYLVYKMVSKTPKLPMFPAAQPHREGTFFIARGGGARKKMGTF